MIVLIAHNGTLRIDTVYYVIIQSLSSQYYIYHTCTCSRENRKFRRKTMKCSVLIIMPMFQKSNHVLRIDRRRGTYVLVWLLYYLSHSLSLHLLPYLSLISPTPFPFSNLLHPSLQLMSPCLYVVFYIEKNIGPLKSVEVHRP